VTALDEAPSDRQPAHRHLLRTAYALLLNTAGTSVLGLAATLLMARLYSPETVGRNSALVNAMLLVSTFAQLNLAGGLPRFVAVAGQQGARLVAGAYAVSGAVALLGGLGFALIAPQVSDEWAFLADQPALVVLFAVAVLGWGVFALQDAVLTGLRAARWVLVENQAFGVAKLLLLVALAVVLPAWGVFVSWVLPVLLAVGAVNLLLFGRLLPAEAASEGDQPDRAGSSPPLRWGMVRRFVALDYIGLLCSQGYTTALPLVVFATAGAAGSAPFALAYSVSTALDMVAHNVGSSLTAEGARAPERLAEFTRRLLGRASLILAAVVLVVGAAAPVIATIAGPAYRDAAVLLALLAVAAIPRMVIIIEIASARVRGTMRRIVGVQAATSVATVLAAVVLAGRYGPVGVAAGAVLGATMVALALLPRLIRRTTGGAARLTD
jgi:O-antigen/teichoic acid export membrane protein